MYKKIADEEHCPACKTITKAALFDVFCDWCEAQIEVNSETRQMIDVLPEDIENRVTPRPEPEFCGMDCLFKWLRSDKYREWTKLEIVRTGKITPFDFLSLAQMDRLVEELRK